MKKLIRHSSLYLFNLFANGFDYRTKREVAKYEGVLTPSHECFNDGLKLMIVKDLWLLCRHYIFACRDLKVNYKVIDLAENNWLDEISEYSPDAIVAWPTVLTSVDKKMFDDRLKLIVNILKIRVFPDVDGLWFWESKHRMSDWLKINDYTVPQTWMFNSISTALEFASHCKIPVVFKSEFGSGGRGVKIFHSRSELKRFVKKYFKKGFITQDRHTLDKEWGRLFLQEYLECVDEWRIMRVGNSYFGYKKIAVDGLHSGSTLWEYGEPPVKLLNNCKMVSEAHNLKSVAIDYFISGERSLINEVQVYFGMAYKSEMCVLNGKAGRYVERDSNWVFEEGAFCENNLCNERVEYLLSEYKLGSY